MMKTLVLCLVALLPLSSPAQTPPPPKTLAVYRDITWEELVPKDWNPLKAFQNMDLASMKDGDPKADALLKRMREAWDNAPINRALAGASVRLPGYVVPLEETNAGLKEFLLVPYFGACIHSPPPPANQIIHVLPSTPIKGQRAMDTVWVSGTLQTVRTDKGDMGASGYQMTAAKVEPYTGKPAY